MCDKYKQYYTFLYVMCDNLLRVYIMCNNKFAYIQMHCSMLYCITDYSHTISFAFYFITCMLILM